MSVEIHELQEEWDVKHQIEAFKEARPHESIHVAGTHVSEQRTY